MDILLGTYSITLPTICVVFFFARLSDRDIMKFKRVIIIFYFYFLYFKLNIILRLPVSTGRRICR
jgi:hypothetical protein